MLSQLISASLLFVLLSSMALAMRNGAYVWVLITFIPHECSFSLVGLFCYSVPLSRGTIKFITDRTFLGLKMR